MRRGQLVAQHSRASLPLHFRLSRNKLLETDYLNINDEKVLLNEFQDNRHYRIIIEPSGTDREGRCSGDVLDSYSVGARFEYQSDTDYRV